MLRGLYTFVFVQKIYLDLLYLNFKFNNTFFNDNKVENII